MVKKWTMSADTSRAKQKEETRERIFSAAIELFEEKGFYKTKVADIARQAKVSAGSIYAHFGSPERILVESHRLLLAKRAAALIEMRNNWPPHEPAWDLFKSHLDEVWGLNSRMRMENVSAYQSWCWVCDAEDYIPMREMYSDVFEELVLVAEMAQKEGSIPAHVDVLPTFEILTAVFFQSLQVARLGQERFHEQYQRFNLTVDTLFEIQQLKRKSA